VQQLHNWGRVEYRLGKSEHGDRCTGCRQYIALNTTVVVKRQLTDYTRKSPDGRHLPLWGPPLETWHEICFDLVVVAHYRSLGRQIPGIGPSKEFVIIDR
jgi:hypothetical protein